MRPVDKTHRKIVLSFDADRGTFSGKTGCNDLAGHFAVTSGTLMLKPASLQICRVDQRTERAVKGVFNDTRSYRVSGSTLEFLDAKGKVVARLVR